MHRIDKSSAVRARSGAGGWWGGVPPVIRLFFLIDAAFVAAYLANLFFFHQVLLLNIYLDLDHDQSVPSWYSSSQLLLVGVLLATLAAHISGKLNKVRLGFAAALFFFLSKEECYGFHEFLMFRLASQASEQGAQAATFFRYSTAWPLYLGPPLLAAMLVLGWRMSSIIRGRPGVVRNCILGLILFVGGAVGMETLVNVVTPGGMSHTIEVVAEETCEMVGVTFFLWAAYNLLGSYGIRLVESKADEEGPGEHVRGPHLPGRRAAPSTTPSDRAEEPPPDGRGTIRTGRAGLSD